MEYATMVKEINIKKTKNIWVGYLHGRYEYSDEVWKRKRPLTIYIYIYIFGRCVDMYAGCWCKLEDVMIKDHHKGNVYLMFIPLILQISKWVYAGLPREDLWMSSTTHAHVVGWKLLK